MKDGAVRHLTPPPLWTHQETAAYLRIDPGMLDRLVIVGAGPTRYWVGHHRRYDPAVVATWLARTCQPGHTRGRHSADTSAAACVDGNLS
jgi:hypothetical protein